MAYPKTLVDRVKALRSEGKTYTEIQRALKRRFYKGTLSAWCRDVSLPEKYASRLRTMVLKNVQEGQRRARKVLADRRRREWDKLYAKNAHYRNVFGDVSTVKLMLAILYLGEGSKTRHGSMMFGNSDPAIVRLFLRLLRTAFSVDEKKLRCTVQCRADQNIRELESFWSGATDIPLHQFYAARVDPRSIGVKSKKKDYKGVCRIDYFSAMVYHECLAIADILTGQPKRGPIFQW